jgi:hypothetical protein
MKYKWLNKSISKKTVTKTTCDSVNDTRLPKKVFLPEWARRDKQVIKGDRVEWGHHAHLILLNFLGLLFRSLYLHNSLMAATNHASDTSESYF